MLPNSAIVDAEVAGKDGILASVKAGATILDMSTVDPNTTDRIAHLSMEAGIGFVDATVGRLASHADRRESLFMGGALEDFERVKPLLGGWVRLFFMSAR